MSSVLEMEKKKKVPGRAGQFCYNEKQYSILILQWVGKKN